MPVSTSIAYNTDPNGAHPKDNITYTQQIEQQQTIELERTDPPNDDQNSTPPVNPPNDYLNSDMSQTSQMVVVSQQQVVPAETRATPSGMNFVDASRTAITTGENNPVNEGEATDDDKEHHERNQENNEQNEEQ